MPSADPYSSLATHTHRAEQSSAEQSSAAMVRPSPPLALPFLLLALASRSRAFQPPPPTGGAARAHPSPPRPHPPLPAVASDPESDEATTSALGVSFVGPAGRAKPKRWEVAELGGGKQTGQNQTTRTARTAKTTRGGRGRGSRYTEQERLQYRLNQASGLVAEADARAAAAERRVALLAAELGGRVAAGTGAEKEKKKEEQELARRKETEEREGEVRSLRVQVREWAERLRTETAAAAARLAEAEEAAAGTRRTLEVVRAELADATEAVDLYRSEGVRARTVAEELEVRLEEERKEAVGRDRVARTKIAALEEGVREGALERGRIREAAAAREAKLGEELVELRAEATEERDQLRKIVRLREAALLELEEERGSLRRLVGRIGTVLRDRAAGRGRAVRDGARSAGARIGRGARGLRSRLVGGEGGKGEEEEGN